MQQRPKTRPREDIHLSVRRAPTRNLFGKSACALQSAQAALRPPHLLLVGKEGETRGIDVERSQHGLYRGVAGQDHLDRRGPSAISDHLEEPGGGPSPVGGRGAQLGANLVASTVVTACLLRVTSKRPALLP